MNKKKLTALLLLAIVFMACNGPAKKNNTMNELAAKVDAFIPIRLSADLSTLSENERKMIPLLIEVSDIMDAIFWEQAYGNREALLTKIKSNQEESLIMINYGPWERLNNNTPFVNGYGPKPAGANFYPSDMTPEEFEALDNSAKTSQYTLLRRDNNGKLTVVPYHQAWSEQTQKAATLIEQAAAMAEDQGLKNYLLKRKQALLTSDYLESDMAWMEMKTNRLDFIAGPIETYEDQLFGYKAAYEAYILIKDMDWSQRLEKYTALLPQLQHELPVDEKYKKEMPGEDSELNAYDAIYYAGDCNAGSKTIAINLPNDERVTLAKGSRRLQLKNVMQAKFDHIARPISSVLIVPEQQQHVTFGAFFANTMFHEVAHGLGVMNTITGTGTVREALKETYTTLEEGKADILGLYLVSKLREMNEIENELMDNYVTFLAGIFRSIRFGSASAHGKANLIRFNYFREKNAFAIDEHGRFSVNFAEMQQAVSGLSELIITIQGNGDYEAARELIEKYAILTDALKEALQRVAAANIPVDIVFEQGLEVLGLTGK